MKKLEGGYTLLEISLSMLFVSLLSIAVVIVINNTISSYQRGSVLSRLDSLGSNLVEDVRNSVQDSDTRTRLGKNISINKTSTITIDGTDYENVPIYGVFCSGSYTYFWNSGYYFSNDASFDEKNNQEWAKIQIGDGIFYDPDGKGPNELGFRLAKIKDPERKICLNVITKAQPESKDYSNITPQNNNIENVFDITILEESESPTNLLPNNEEGADLALYEFSSSIPATNYFENISLYRITMTLGTVTGGVEPTFNGGSTCAAPLNDTNWSNSCAVSDFTVAVQSNTNTLSTIEQTFNGEIPEPPTPQSKTLRVAYNPNCSVDTSRLTSIETYFYQLGSPVPITIANASNFGWAKCGSKVFSKWNTSQIGVGIDYYPNQTESITDNLVLYAQWESVLATVTYFPNGGTPDAPVIHTPSPYVEDTIKLYSAKKAGFSRKYYTLAGWEKSDTKKSYAPGKSYKVTDENTNFDAIWTRDLYNITYHRLCGYTDTATEQINVGDNYTIKTNQDAQNNQPWTCQNNVFLGWTTDKNNQVADSNYAPGTTITPTKSGSLNLYAVWDSEAYTCTKQYRLQNADGTYPSSYTFDSTESIAYGSTCSYTKTITDYNNNSPLSTTATNVTENVTLSLDFPRNTYDLTVLAGNNVSNPTGSGTYRWGQSVEIGVTKNNNTSCLSYDTPIWSISNGAAGSFSPASGTKVNYTMGKGASTVIANSAANDIAKTLTFKTKDANTITLNGNSKTDNQTLSIQCGTYSITGSFPTGYQFYSWSATAGSFANASVLNTTYTVTDNAIITLTGYNTSYQVIYRRNCSSSDTITKVYQVNSGASHTIISKPSNFTCSGYTFDGWQNADWPYGSFTIGSTVTVGSNITINAKWKQETVEPENPPVIPPSTSCPSGFSEWTTGLCWRNQDQGGYKNYNEASTSCSNNGWRLPTLSEYGQLIRNYCNSAYNNGTVYCTADSITPKGFGFNGAYITFTEVAYSQAYESCMEEYSKLLKTCKSTGMSESACKAMLASQGISDCSEFADQVSEQTTSKYDGVKTYGFYWASGNSNAMTIMKENGKTSATTHGDKWDNLNKDNSVVRISTRCVVNKK